MLAVQVHHSEWTAVKKLKTRSFKTHCTSSNVEQSYLANSTYGPNKIEPWLQPLGFLFFFCCSCFLYPQDFTMTPSNETKLKGPFPSATCTACHLIKGQRHIVSCALLSLFNFYLSMVKACWVNSIIIILFLGCSMAVLFYFIFSLATK